MPDQEALLKLMTSPESNWDNIQTFRKMINTIDPDTAEVDAAITDDDIEVTYSELFDEDKICELLGDCFDEAEAEDHSLLANITEKFGEGLQDSMGNSFLWKACVGVGGVGVQLGGRNCDIVVRVGGMVTMKFWKEAEE
jgi:hypothetical protein